MGRNRPKPLLQNVIIEDITSEGKAIAHVDHVVVFVPMGIPGDVCNVQVTTKRKNYMEGHIVQLVTPSPLRKKPHCPHFGVCGGCKWQHLPYVEQLKYKQQQVKDAITRIGKMTPEIFHEILASESTEYYRNKMEFTFSNKRWLTREEIETQQTLVKSEALGLHIPGMFDKVLDINVCFHQPEPSNMIRQKLKDFAIKNNIPFFDLREHSGTLRTLTIRNNEKGEFMVIVAFSKEEDETIEKVMNFLKESFPQIVSLQYVINTKANDTIHDLELKVWNGQDHLIEEMEGLKFRVGPKSFYQTNSQQAYRLYKIAREFAELRGTETVYDLYTGTGTIALFVARHCRKVIGIEYVPEAIEDAKANATLNNIVNASFYSGDMKDILNETFISTHGKPDVMIIDPPRAGMHPGVIDTILKNPPRRIVYVSCNPSTQARDMNLLSNRYSLSIVQPVDMFPHTHHVENVILLTLNDN